MSLGSRETLEFRVSLLEARLGKLEAMVHARCCPTLKEEAEPRKAGVRHGVWHD